MPAEREGCREFRDTLHRYLDENLALVDQATFVGHLAVCPSCRGALLQFSHHIQAHKILAAGGQLDAESAQSLRAAVPLEFSAVSERVVRARARTLGQLKFQILQVYLKHILSEHAWPEVLDEAGLQKAHDASRSLLDNLERYKESSVIFADGGPVDLKDLRAVLDSPIDPDHEGLDPQLLNIARGLLSARTLDPSLDEYVLQLLGAILEQLGFFAEARQMFLTLANVGSKARNHLRSRALSSAARTSIRFLGDFAPALEWLKEANQLYPHRWTIEYNLASWYLWRTNPHRDVKEGARWFRACQKDCPKEETLQNLLLHDPPMQGLCRDTGLL